MANTAAQELLAEAKCFACVQSNSNFVALLLALINRGIVAAGGTRMTAQQLMTAGSCFACIQDMTQGEAMTLAAMNALVAQIAAGGGGPGTTPTLSQVLTQGDDGGAQNIVNVDTVVLGDTTPAAVDPKFQIIGTGIVGIYYQNTGLGNWATYVGVGGSDAWGIYSYTLGADVFVFSADNGGRVGILTPSPSRTLDVNGDTNIAGGLDVGLNSTFSQSLHVLGGCTVDGNLDVTGKITGTGGIDPPYLLLDRETRESIKERVLKEVPDKKLGGAAMFFNSDSGSPEFYIAESDRYYNLAGELLI